MKKMVLLSILLCFVASVSLAQSQTSNVVTLTGVTPPTAPVITVTSPALSPTGKYYCGTGFTITVTATSGTFSTGAVINWNATTLTTTSVSSTVLTAPVSTAQATCGTNTVSVTQPLPQLTMNSPVTLPNAKVGVAYTTNLGQAVGLTGGVPPYTFSCNNPCSLPTGLSLSASGSITGTPSSSGSFTFGFTVTDSSGLAIKKIERTLEVEAVIAARK